MAKRLEASYRLKYAAQQADEVGFTGIPDGGFKTICVPVPVSRLADVYRCFGEMSGDARLTTPASGRLELRFGTINYVVGKSPAWTRIPGGCLPPRSRDAGSCPSGCRSSSTARTGRVRGPCGGSSTWRRSECLLRASSSLSSGWPSGGSSDGEP